MANLKYCTKCGSKYQYDFAAPKFCVECGVSLSSSPSADINDKPSLTRKGGAKVDEDGMTDATSVPVVTELKASVEFDSNVMTMDFAPSKGFDFHNKKFDKRTTEF